MEEGAAVRKKILGMAALCAILVPHLPFIHYVSYPLNLLVTTFHEMGHALAALASGGSVERIVLFADASGVTYTHGGNNVFIASAGYLGSTMAGCLLLLLAQHGRLHRIIVLGLLIYFSVFTVLFARNVFALMVGGALLFGLCWLASRVRASSQWMYFILDYVALSSCLYSLQHFRHLLSLSLWPGGPTSDAHILASITGIPALLWALGWGILSLALACLSLRQAWRLPPSPRDATPAIR